MTTAGMPPRPDGSTGMARTSGPGRRLLMSVTRSYSPQSQSTSILRALRPRPMAAPATAEMETSGPDPARRDSHEGIQRRRPVVDYLLRWESGGDRRSSLAAFRGVWARHDWGSHLPVRRRSVHPGVYHSHNLSGKDDVLADVTYQMLDGDKAPGTFTVRNYAGSSTSIYGIVGPMAVTWTSSSIVLTARS